MGRPVLAGRAPAAGTSFTKDELDSFETFGWDASQPLPENSAEIFEEISKEAIKECLGDLPLPVDPRTPPIKVVTQDIKTLPPHLQEKFRQKIAEALAYEKQIKDQQRLAAQKEWLDPRSASRWTASSQPPPD